MKPVTVDRRSETRKAEGISSSTPSYQIRNLLPAILLSLPLWALVYVIWKASPKIELHEHPEKHITTVKVVREQLDGYLPGVRK